MNSIQEIRKQVKKYIDETDDTTVKMIHAMFETQQQSDWWDDMPENVQKEIDSAIQDLDQGKGIPHEKMKEMYPQWFKNNLVPSCCTNLSKQHRIFTERVDTKGDRQIAVTERKLNLLSWWGLLCWQVR